MKIAFLLSLNSMTDFQPLVVQEKDALSSVCKISFRRMFQTLYFFYGLGLPKSSDAKAPVGWVKIEKKKIEIKKRAPLDYCQIW